jgi:cellulose synthase/poly-beta-1,6-N-acetylglucosamine synthase-like glycosyltransferase
VLIQLPLHNENLVVERLIESVAALDYPADKLMIQVLDDASTDNTACLAQAKIDCDAWRGKKIDYIYRAERSGFKAGALAKGMALSPGEFIAVFDADFIPRPDFLRRILPEFQRDPRLGMVQARWDHLNAGENPITRFEAMALDTIFGMDQIARSRAGFMMQFNGSAGVWRREAIEDAGGWHNDTLVEDMDISYRAQLKGWRLTYRPDISVPGELPPSLMIFKQQQFRWAKGAMQVLLKSGGPVLTSKKTVIQKIEAFFHLGGFLTCPVQILWLLLCLPMLVIHGQTPINLALLGLAAFFPPVAVLWSQISLHPDWPKRVVYYPFLFLVGVGLSVNNTFAMAQALSGQTGIFVRTPKFVNGTQPHHMANKRFSWITFTEVVFAVYATLIAVIAVYFAPGLAPFAFLYAIGFGFTAATTIIE